MKESHERMNFAKGLTLHKRIGDAAMGKEFICIDNELAIEALDKEKDSNSDAANNKFDRSLARLEEGNFIVYEGPSDSEDFSSDDSIFATPKINAKTKHVLPSTNNKASEQILISKEMDLHNESERNAPSEKSHQNSDENESNAIALEDNIAMKTDANVQSEDADMAESSDNEKEIKSATRVTRSRNRERATVDSARRGRRGRGARGGRVGGRH